MIRDRFTFSQKLFACMFSAKPKTFPKARTRVGLIATISKRNSLNFCLRIFQHILLTGAIGRRLTILIIKNFKAKLHKVIKSCQKLAAKFSMQPKFPIHLMPEYQLFISSGTKLRKFLFSQSSKNLLKNWHSRLSVVIIAKK